MEREAFPARLHVLLASGSSRAVVLRRGPSGAVASFLWDRRDDSFALGQWLRGRIYERRADLSPDGRHAHVLVGVRGDERARKEAFQALEHAAHYLRHQLAERLSLRRVPELHFQLDAGEGSEERIERLLQRARKTRGQNEKLSSK